MVQAQGETREILDQDAFYRLRAGAFTKEIPGTLGHLLSLPVKAIDTDSGYELITCVGPSDRETVRDFWRELVLSQGVKLIVNLCNKVGEFGDWRDDCSQYWPTSVE